MEKENIGRQEASDIETALEGMKYPTTRDELLKFVTDSDPHNLAEIIEKFPDEELHSFEQVRRLMNEKKAGDL